MLLEKKEEIIEESGTTYVSETCLYSSSNILASHYSEKDKDLKIIFVNSISYVYSEVSLEDYVWFRSHKSQGEVLSSRLKTYSYKKNDEKEDIEELVKRKKELK